MIAVYSAVYRVAELLYNVSIVTHHCVHSALCVIFVHISTVTTYM